MGEIRVACQTGGDLGMARVCYGGYGDVCLQRTEGFHHCFRAQAISDEPDAFHNSIPPFFVRGRFSLYYI
jgi:hypothetical protein